MLYYAIVYLYVSGVAMGWAGFAKHKIEPPAIRGAPESRFI